MKRAAKGTKDRVTAGARLPLSALLSKVLVAFTIELDNEFERQLPHRTTVSKRERGGSGPWLLSLAMYSHFLRFVGDGISVGEFQQAAHLDKKSTENWLTRMERWWGYVVVAPGGSGAAAGRSEWMIHPTTGGRCAMEIWRSLLGLIEERWSTRFGAEEVGLLRSSLMEIVEAIDEELPEYLPILGYGLFSEVSGWTGKKRPVKSGEPMPVVRLSLPALLSKVLLAIAVEFEREWPVSLAIYANVLRLLTEEGVPLRELPRLSGVSKQAIAMAAGFLEKREYAESAMGAGKTKLLRLTAQGEWMREACRLRLDSVERNLESGFGGEKAGGLRHSLQQCLERRDGEQLLLSEGLLPPAGGWRASKAYIAQTVAMIEDPAAMLPHYPMVLHRGGYPDGS